MADYERKSVWAPIDQYALDRKTKLMKIGGYLGMLMAIALGSTIADLHWYEWLKSLVCGFDIVFFLVMAALVGEADRGLSEDAITTLMEIERQQFREETQRKGPK